MQMQAKSTKSKQILATQERDQLAMTNIIKPHVFFFLAKAMNIKQIQANARKCKRMQAKANKYKQANASRSKQIQASKCKQKPAK